MQRNNCGYSVSVVTLVLYINFGGNFRHVAWDALAALKVQIVSLTNLHYIVPLIDLHYVVPLIKSKWLIGSSSDS